MLISLKDDKKVPFPVCISVEPRWREGSIFCMLSSWEDDGQVPLRVFLLVNKLTDRPFSCLLTSRQDGGQVPFPAYLTVDKMPDRFRFLSAHRKWHDGRQAPNSCLLTCWRDGKQRPILLRDYHWQNGDRSYFPTAYQLSRYLWWNCLILLFAYHLTRWQKDSIYCLHDKMVDNPIFLFAF